MLLTLYLELFLQHAYLLLCPVLTGASNESDRQQVDADPASSPVFQFEGSLSSNKSVELYGTLPHRRKVKSTNNAPPKSPGLAPKLSVGSMQDSSRSAVKRAEGFSRLLEFTRQQVELETSTSSADFEVTQSLPVYANNMLPVSGGGVEDMIAEDGDREFEKALSSSGTESSDMNIAHAILLEHENEPIQKQLASTNLLETTPQTDIMTAAKDATIDSQPEGGAEANVSPVAVENKMDEQEDATREDGTAGTKEEILEAVEDSKMEEQEDVRREEIVAGTKEEMPETIEAVEPSPVSDDTTELMTVKNQALLPNQTQVPASRPQVPASRQSGGGLYDTLGYCRRLLGSYFGSKAVLIPLVVGVTAVVVFYSIGGYFTR